MLIVLLHNDGTGKDNVGNYDVEVRVNERTIYRGRINGHNRDDGWQGLLIKLGIAGNMDKGGLFGPIPERI